MIGHEKVSEKRIWNLITHILLIIKPSRGSESEDVQRKQKIRAFNRGTQRQFLENICSEDDLRSRIFGTFVVKFLACLPLLGFSNI